MKKPTKVGAALVISITCMLILSSCISSDQGNKGGKDMNVGSEETQHSLERIGGENIANTLLAGEYERLYNQFSSSLKAIVSLEDFRSMGHDFVSGITSFSRTSALKLNGFEAFVWADQTGTRGLTATIDEKGIITGMRIMEHTSYPETDTAYSKTIFDFPFRGEWLVVWGGHNIFVNYHYEYEQVRYAYDFLIEKNGYSYEGDPTVNESYYAFNQDVLAPAEGVVVAVVDGIIDNVVGQVNEDQPLGNMVTIKHNNGEYSTIAHLKQGSVQVKLGDQVQAHQLIGKCGNSGNSTEPHIHFQVSASAPKNQADMNTIPPSYKHDIRPIQGNKVTGPVGR